MHWPKCKYPFSGDPLDPQGSYWVLKLNPGHPLLCKASIISIFRFVKLDWGNTWKTRCTADKKAIWNVTLSWRDISFDTGEKKVHRLLIDYYNPLYHPFKSECYWESTVHLRGSALASFWFLRLNTYSLTVRRITIWRQLLSTLHVNSTRGNPSMYIFSWNFKTSIFKNIIYTR